MVNDNFLRICVTDIDWDTEENGEEEDVSLPKDVLISDRFKEGDYTDEAGEIDTDALLDDVSDYLSDTYGFCHRGFHTEIYREKSLLEIASLHNV